MTEASYDTFTDRRTDAQRVGELATQILFWYDEEGAGLSWLDVKRDQKTRNLKMKRRRTNGIAVTMEGTLVVARSICSRKDQFSASNGRHVVEQRILNAEIAETRSVRRKAIAESEGAKPNEDYCWILRLDAVELDELPKEAARAYAEMFPEDDRGIKRAFNAGNVYVRYKTDLARRAAELDTFNG